MRRIAVLTFGAGAAIVLLACGGPPFTLVTSPDDATVGDGPTDTADAGNGLDAAEADALDDASTSDVRDARAPRDAGAIDAGSDASVSDALVSDADAGDDAPDVPDAPPPHCGDAFVCAPAVPAGWSGPFEVYVGSTALPACGAGFSGTLLDGQSGLSAPPASCGCGCGQATGVQCSSPALAFFSGSAACKMGTSCASLTLTEGACTPIDVSAPCGSVLGTAMTLPQSTASQGSCAPLAATTVAPPSWTTAARACGASPAPVQADCPAGSVCAPTPSGPFEPTLCIEQPGVVPACPAVAYTGRSIVFGAVSDTRGCSACTCGAVTGASCSGSVTQFASSDAGCDTGQTIYPLGQSCDPVQQPSSLELAVTSSGGSCAPSPVVATGAAIPTQPMTFCCIQ